MEAFFIKKSKMMQFVLHDDPSAKQSNHFNRPVGHFYDRHSYNDKIAMLNIGRHLRCVGYDMWNNVTAARLVFQRFLQRAVKALVIGFGHNRSDCQRDSAYASNKDEFSYKVQKLDNHGGLQQ